MSDWGVSNEDYLALFVFYRIKAISSICLETNGSDPFFDPFFFMRFIAELKQLHQYDLKKMGLPPFSLVMRLLRRKFGLQIQLDPLLTQLQILPVEKLEDLTEALFDLNEVSNLTDWLKRNV